MRTSIAVLLLLSVSYCFGTNVKQAYYDFTAFSNAELASHSDHYLDGIEGTLGDRSPPFVWTDSTNGYILTYTDANDDSKQAVTFCNLSGYADITSSADDQTIKVTFSGRLITAFGYELQTAVGNCGGFVDGTIRVTLSSGEHYDVVTNHGSAFLGEQFFGVSVHNPISWATFQPLVPGQRVVLDYTAGYGPTSFCAYPTQDCDSNGSCETNIATSDTNCGYCGNNCNTKPHVVSGTCVKHFCVPTCQPHFFDCNKVGSDGCEIDVRKNHKHCGACGNACATGEQCKNGVCELDCWPGHANCDGVASNFCEVNILNDWRHCGSCSKVCSLANAVSECKAGSCQVRLCYNGFCNTDGNDANGCEASC